MKKANLVTTFLLLFSLTTSNCFAALANENPKAVGSSIQVQIPERIANDICYKEFIKDGLKYANDSSNIYLERAENYAKNDKKSFASINYLLASVGSVSKRDYGTADSYIRKIFDLVANATVKEKKGFAGCLFLIGSNYRTKQRADREKAVSFYNEYSLKAFNELSCSNCKYFVLASIKKLKQLNYEKKVDEAIALVNNLLYHFEKEKNVYPEQLKQVSSAIAFSYTRKQSEEKIAQLKRLLKLCKLPDMKCSDLESIPVLETLSNRCAAYRKPDLSDMYAEQILEIASKQTDPKEQDRRALKELKNTLQRIAGNRKVKRLKNNMVIEEQKEKVLLLLFDLSKKNANVTYDSVKKLEQLSIFYQQQNSTAKVLPLYKKAMINLEALSRDPRKQRSANSIKLKLKKGYLKALTAAGNSSSWETLQAEISEKAKSVTISDTKSKTKVASNVDYSKDPGRHIDKLTKLARTEISAGKKKDGLNLLKKAISAYESIPSGSRELLGASKTLWSALANAAKMSKDKSFDEVINKLAVIYGAKKAIKPRQRTISPVYNYMRAKQFNKAEALLIVILKSRENVFGVDDPDLVEVLDLLAQISVKTNNVNKYSKAADRALLLSKQQIPLNFSMLQKRINKMMTQYVAFGKKQKSDLLEDQYKDAVAKSSK